MIDQWYNVFTLIQSSCFSCMYVRVDFLLQDENRLLEKQLFQRLDALQEMMMDRVAETRPQEEGERPEKVKHVH